MLSAACISVLLYPLPHSDTLSVTLVFFQATLPINVGANYTNFELWSKHTSTSSSLGLRKLLYPEKSKKYKMQKCSLEALGETLNTNGSFDDILRCFIPTVFIHLFAGETHSVIGCSQRPPNERSDTAEGAIQHADPQRHLTHQPQQTADHWKRRVQEQQQLLECLRESSDECLSAYSHYRRGRLHTYMHVWKHAKFERLQGCAWIFFYFISKADTSEDVKVKTSLSRKRWDDSMMQGSLRDHQTALITGAMARRGGGERTCTYETVHQTLCQRMYAVAGTFQDPVDTWDKPLCNHTQWRAPDVVALASPLSSSFSLSLYPFNDQVDPLKNNNTLLRIITFVVLRGLLSSALFQSHCLLRTK